MGRGRPKEVKTTMNEIPDGGTDDEDDHIKATVAIKAWRFYVRGKTPVTVDVLQQQGISTENRGRAGELIREMAEDDSAPLKWDTKAFDRVNLAGEDKDENRGWVRSWAIRHGYDNEELPWKLRK